MCDRVDQHPLQKLPFFQGRMRLFPIFQEFRLWHICEIGIPSNLKEKLLGEGRKKGLLAAAYTNFPLFLEFYTPEKMWSRIHVFQMGN